MAEVPVIIAIGSSNMAGYLAKLEDVPDGDIVRWFGVGAATLSGWPKRLTMPGVRSWTPKLPYGTVNTYTVTSYGAATVAVSTTPFVAGDVGTFVFVATNTAGQGQVRRITAVGSASEVTITPAWSPLPGNNGTLVVIRDSHRIASVSADLLTVTKHADSPAFTAAVVGKFVLFFAAYGSSPAGAIFSLTRKIVAQTAQTITLEAALGFSPAVDTGFAVLTGTGAAQSLATIGTDAALRDLALDLNTAPVYLTGYDYDNWDRTPFASPLAVLGAFDSPMPPTTINPTINSIPEMAWQFRARFNAPLVILEFGISSSMISPFILPPGPGHVSWAHDIVQLDFHPSSPDSLYVALAASITSLRTLIEGEGNAMKVKAICINCADNDAQAVRYLNIGANMVLLRDALRTLIGDQTVPFIMSGPSAYGGTALQPSVYAQLQQVELEDQNSAYIDTRVGYGKAADGLHLSAAGQVQLGKDFPIAYDRIKTGSTFSDIDVCNLALSHIGASAKITTLDGTDTSAEARHCVRFYLPTLRALLEIHSWDFATRRTELVEVTNTRDEYAYAYEAPREMAFGIAVLAPGSASDAPTLPFLKEIDPAGRMVIYTDVDDAVVRYNRYVKNTRLQSESFKRAHSWLLASDLAGAIIKGVEGMKMAAHCLEMMRTFFGQATKHDSNQRKVEPETEAPWM